MPLFTYRLEHADGSPADPPSFETAVSNWRVGDSIPIRRDETFRVVGVVAGAELDDDPTLIVESSASGRDAA
jgi:hypothetical protein